MTELHWTEIDGVTTVWADALTPLQAGLCFRVGRTDETLITSGLTHLVEHLALSAISDPMHHNNGFVGGVTTNFVTVGQPSEVSAFFADICSVLSSLPVDRLTSEKKILAAEQASLQYDFLSTLLMWRYGARGYGLLGMNELGREKITPEQLQNHSNQWFTRGNVILWLSGPPPADLRLKLPNGTRMQVNTLAPIQKTFPAWHVDDACGGIGVDATVPRISAATVFGEIAVRRLKQRLRTAKAISYNPTAFYNPLTADTAHVVLYADSAPDCRAELAKEFGEFFDGLDQVDKSEVEEIQTYIRDHRTGPLAPSLEYRAMMEVHRAVVDWTLGREFESLETITDELMAVTIDDVMAFIQSLKATAMFALPGKAIVQPWAGAKSPPSTLPVVKGHKVRLVDSPIHKHELVHGSDGVSLLLADGGNITVRYSDLAAALTFTDGGIQLIGSDAGVVTIEPKLWEDGAFVCLQVRERLPDHMLLNLGTRPADSIPKPETTAWQRFRYRLNHL